MSGTASRPDRQRDTNSTLYSMASMTDIPDWLSNEAGQEFTWQEEEACQLANKFDMSPIREDTLTSMEWMDTV